MRTTSSPRSFRRSDLILNTGNTSFEKFRKGLETENPLGFDDESVGQLPKG